ncbi:LysR family transcriptional regulator [Ktedonosporobacter rubrisoli]|uniref:LysR family transcriptional regulator n=1 Tax=Ktedonosporobacter rubrisoli TaxID=2509675 RepID=UPI0013EED5A4|nr:LysR family transcriptional regulator [Ktedonosporobacter rubrisoli]
MNRVKTEALKVDFLDLQAFIEAADRNFQQAAVSLDVYQSTVSNRVQNLEKRLGVELFNRENRRQVTLTPAGQAFREEAQRLCRQWEEAVEQAHRAARGEDRPVYIGYTGTALWSILLEITTICRTCTPPLKVISRDLSVRAQLRALRAHQLDVGFAITPEIRAGLQYKTLFACPMLLALHEDHPLAAEREVRLSELKQEHWIWFSRDANPHYHDYNLRQCQNVGLYPTIDHFTDQPYAMVSMVSHGLGASLVTAWTAVLKLPHVKYKRTIPAWNVELQMVWRKDEYSTAAQNFMQLVCETVEQRQNGLDGLNID